MSWAMRWDLRWCLKLYREEQFLMEVGIEFHVTGELYIPQNNKTVRIRMQLGHWSFCVCVCVQSLHTGIHMIPWRTTLKKNWRMYKFLALNVWLRTTKRTARSSVSSRTVQILTSTSSPSWNWVEAEAEDELGGSRTSVAATVLHRWQLQSQHQFQVTATLKTSATGHQLLTKYTVTQKSHSVSPRTHLPSTNIGRNNWDKWNQTMQTEACYLLSKVTVMPLSAMLFRYAWTQHTIFCLPTKKTATYEASHVSAKSDILKKWQRNTYLHRNISFCTNICSCTVNSLSDNNADGVRLCKWVMDVNYYLIPC